MMVYEKTSDGSAARRCTRPGRRVCATALLLALAGCLVLLTGGGCSDRSVDGLPTETAADGAASSRPAHPRDGAPDDSTSRRPDSATLDADASADPAGDLRAFCTAGAKAWLNGAKIDVAKLKPAIYTTGGFHYVELYFASRTQRDNLTAAIRIASDSPVQPPATVDLANVPRGWEVGVNVNCSRQFCWAYGLVTGGDDFHGHATVSSVSARSRVTLCLRASEGIKPHRTVHAVALYANVVVDPSPSP